MSEVSIVNGMESVTYGDITVQGASCSSVLEFIVEFFNKSSVSVGSYCRKSLYLLIKLSYLTNSRWRSYTLYRSSTGYCSTILYTQHSTGFTRVEIAHTFVGSNTLRGIRDTVQATLKSDKYFGDHMSTTARLYTNYGTYECNRTAFKRSRRGTSSDMSTALFQLTVDDVSSRGRRLLRRVTTPTTVEVQKCEILNVSDADTGQMPIDILDVLD